MKKIVNKLIIILIAVFAVFPLFSYKASALGNGGTGPCFEPASATYTSQDCVRTRLGLNQIDPQALLVKRDPGAYILLGFRIFLAVAILLTIYRIVLAGIKVSNSQDDADKRKEAFKTVMFAVVGMVIALSALGLTYIVQKVFFGETFNDVIVNCKDPVFLANSPQRIKDECFKVTGQTP